MKNPGNQEELREFVGDRVFLRRIGILTINFEVLKPNLKKILMKGLQALKT